MADKFTISKSVIENGKWYQPYLHSVPWTFNRAQEAYYNGFSLDNARGKAMAMAKKIFGVLENYYGQREKELAEFLGVSHSELESSFSELFTDFDQAFLEARTKYPLVNELTKALKSLKNNKPTNSDATKSIEILVKKAFKNLKMPKSQQEKAVPQTIALLTVMKDQMTEIFDKAGIPAPQNMLEKALTNIAQGKDPGFRNQDFRKAIELAGKEATGLNSLLSFIRAGTDPRTKEGKWRKDNYASGLARQFGFFNELLIEEIIDSMKIKGRNVILKNLKETIQTGTKKVMEDVTDVKLILKNSRGDTFNLGIDVKSTFTIAGKNREYKRGKNVKKVSELFDLIPSSKDVNAFIYLVANSYYWRSNPELSMDWYEEFLGSGRKFYALLNATVALYGLLPPGLAIGSNLSSVESQIKKDTRIFITVNNTAILMTEFLGAVRKTVLEGGSQGKPIFGKEMNANLNKILDKWNTQLDIAFPGKLYFDKIDLLSTITDRRVSGYKKLKSELIDPVTGTALKDWKYTINRNQFKF